MNKLGENLRPQLSRWSTQHHQLDPLGDAVTQRNGTLHHGDVLHAAGANIFQIVYELMEETEREGGGGRDRGRREGEASTTARKLKCFLQ